MIGTDTVGWWACFYPVTLFSNHYLLDVARLKLAAIFLHYNSNNEYSLTIKHFVIYWKGHKRHYAIADPFLLQDHGQLREHHVQAPHNFSFELVKKGNTAKWFNNIQNTPMFPCHILLHAPFSFYYSVILWQFLRENSITSTGVIYYTLAWHTGMKNWSCWTILSPAVNKHVLTILQK